MTVSLNLVNNSVLNKLSQMFGKTINPSLFTGRESGVVLLLQMASTIHPTNYRIPYDHLYRNKSYTDTKIMLFQKKDYDFNIIYLGFSYGLFGVLYRR